MKRLIYRIPRFLFKMMFKWLYRLTVYGNDVSKCPEGAIIASNHASYFDPPLLGACWPEEVHYLARNSLFSNSFFGDLLRRVNAHPVVQQGINKTVLKYICQLIKSGKKVVIFPEGSRTFDGEMSAAKPGVATVAMMAKCPIIPAYVHGMYEVWPRQKKIPRLRGKIACIFGKPIYYEEYQHLDRKAAQHAISVRIMEDIAALRNEYFEVKNKK